MLGYVDLGDIKETLAVRRARSIYKQSFALNPWIFFRQVYLDNRKSMGAMGTPFYRLSELFSGVKNFLVGQTLESARINAMYVVQSIDRHRWTEFVESVFVVLDTTSPMISFNHSSAKR